MLQHRQAAAPPPSLLKMFYHYIPRRMYYLKCALSAFRTCKKDDAVRGALRNEYSLYMCVLTCFAAKKKFLLINIAIQKSCSFWLIIIISSVRRAHEMD